MFVHKSLGSVDKAIPPLSSCVVLLYSEAAWRNLWPRQLRMFVSRIILGFVTKEGRRQRFQRSSGAPQACVFPFDRGRFRQFKGK